MTSQTAGLKQINKQFTKYLVPAVIGMIVQALYSVLDGIIVGQGIGEIGLGAVNIALPFYMLILTLSMLIAIGGGNVYSFYKGQGEPEKANNVFCQCLALSTVTGFVLAVTGFIFREKLALILGANEELLPSAIAYLKWLTLFSVLQMVVFTFSVFVRNDDAPKLVMLATVAGAIINMVLDIVFILILRYGIEVAAITNGIGVLIELSFYTVYFLRKRGMLRIKKPKFDFADIKQVFRNGLSASLMEFWQSAIALSFNLALVYTVGTLGVSAYSIVNYVCSVINMILIGVTQGAQPIMSFYHGKGDEKVVSHVYRLGVRTNFIIPILLTGLCAAFGHGIASLFHSGNPELTTLTAHILRLYPLAFLVAGVTLMNILYFQTTERNTYSTLVSLLRCIGFTQVFLLLFMHLLGADGIYLAFLAGELCHFIISRILVRRTMKKLDAVRICPNENASD